MREGYYSVDVRKGCRIGVISDCARKGSLCGHAHLLVNLRNVHDSLCHFKPGGWGKAETVEEILKLRAILQYFDRGIRVPYNQGARLTGEIFRYLVARGHTDPFILIFFVAIQKGIALCSIHRSLLIAVIQVRFHTDTALTHAQLVGQLFPFENAFEHPAITSWMLGMSVKNAEIWVFMIPVRRLVLYVR